MIILSRHRSRLELFPVSRWSNGEVSSFSLHEYNSYAARVSAASGTIVSAAEINEAISTAIKHGYYDDISGWYSPQFAYVNAGSGAVSRYFNLAKYRATELDMFQTTSGSRPVWTASQQNGKAALIFDGGDDYLSTTKDLKSFGVLQGHTVFLVFKHATGSSNYSHVVGSGFSSASVQFHGGADTAQWLTGNLSSCVDNWVNNSIVADPLTITKSTSYKLYTLRSTDDITEGTFEVDVLGWGQGFFGGRAWPGGICEVLIYGPVASDAMIATINADINNRWACY